MYKGHYLINILEEFMTTVSRLLETIMSFNNLNKILKNLNQNYIKNIIKYKTRNKYKNVIGKFINFKNI